MTARYGTQIGGRYLKARFGFEFAEVADPAVQGIQDALFMHASEVARARTGLRRLMQSMAEDFGYMTKGLEGGTEVYSPIGEGPLRDPYGAVRRIERDEQVLKVWCAAVAALQAQHTQEKK